MNEIVVLGAYGAKGEGKGTSSFWLNGHHVIDAGNLLLPLKERVADIEVIWLTHSHLDHIIDIAYMLDNYFSKRKKPLRLMGLPETLEAVKKHFLNNEVWPDFSKIPVHGGVSMSVEYAPIEPGVRYSLDETMQIEAFRTDHTVPSCGYIVKCEESSLLITADTYSLDTAIEAIDRNDEITTLVVECSFPSSMEKLAVASKHLTPKLLFEKLKPLEGRGLSLRINHIKPSYKTVIKEEIARMQGCWKAVILEDGDKIQF